MAWPAIEIASCASGNGSPAATRNCHSTRSWPVIASGHRMLDLQPRIHLHEVEARRPVGDELHRPRADVADGARRRTRGLPHAAAAGGVHAGRGCFLDDFLVPALHRAVALEEVDHVAMRVGEHLDLDVTRPWSDSARSARGHRRRRSVPRACASAIASSRSAARSTMRMPLPPPPADGLDEHREANPRRFGAQQRR